MKIVFMGTPDFAVPCFKRLISDGHQVLAAFTQPDKPKGRGHLLTPPEVKIAATENNIPVYQPHSLKDSQTFELLKGLNPELIVVVAYGKILPENILKLPKFGCINIHASLLPKYRGAAPIQWAVLNGDKVTGITSMEMDAGLDTGDMLLKAQTEIGENETSDELWSRLSEIGAQVMSKTIDGIINGTLVPEKQDDSKATYAHMLSKEFCPIDWRKSAEEIHNQIRGLNSWPIATFMFSSKKLKAYKSFVCNINCDGAAAGQVVDSSGRLVVACGDGRCVEIITLQAEGKRIMSAGDFLRGCKIDEGTVLR